ncbi:MAG: hypothetical protein ACYTGH_02000 [Planctomycetota bacterium]|jgi:hypothetical protein
MKMNHALLLLFWVLPLLAHAPLRGGESYVRELGSSDPLERRVDLDLMDKGLTELVKQLTVRSGIDVLIGDDVALPKEFDSRRLYIETRSMTIRESADWVARSLGTRYRVADGGRTLIFTSSYAFLDRVQPVTRFLNLGGLTTRVDQKAFLGQLQELLKVYLLKEPEYTLRLQGNKLMLMAHLPPVLQERLKATFRLLGKAGRPVKEVGAAPTFTFPQERLSHAVTATYTDWTLANILRDLSFQTGVPIGFDHAPFFGKDMPELSLKLGRTTLGAALKDLCVRIGFQALLPAEGGGVWLSAAPGAKRRLGSRELLWEALIVRAYAVRSLAEKRGRAELTKAVSGAVCDDLRQDPSIGFIYHERSGNLIVIGPATVQDAVAHALWMLKTTEPSVP